MKRSHHKSIGMLAVGVMLISIFSFTSSTAEEENSLLQGSNLGCWNVNGDGTINDPFMADALVRERASAVIGIMRFPCRSFNATQLQLIANTIRNAGIEPLTIITSKNQTNALMQVNALKDIVTYFEFGNENNYADSWSGATYASHWASDIPVLRAAAPEAKFGGPVGSHFDANGSTYMRDFFNGIKGTPSLMPDFISAHVYVEHGEDWTDQTVFDVITNQWGPGIDRMKADIQTAFGTSLDLAITEYNWDAVPEKTGDNRDMNTAFMHNFNSRVLDLFKAKGVWMACQYRFAGTGQLDMVTSTGTAKPQYNEFLYWKAANVGPPNQPPVLTAIEVAPFSASVVTDSTQQFTAIARNQYGVPLSLQPLFTWSVSGGGTINSSGWFTAGGALGGPYTITATSDAVNGTAQVWVTSPTLKEAESMTLTNYTVFSNSSASGGSLIKLSAAGATGTATFTFTRNTGTYDIKVYYYDENDGACTFNVYVAGVKVATWVANQTLGSADPVAQTRTSRTITGVSITNGAQIKLEAVQNDQEWGRFDNVDITRSGTGIMIHPPAEKPTHFTLDQNYPNPFNPETQIWYQLPETSKVQLEIYNITGCKVRVLINRQQSAGSHTVGWDGLDESDQPVSNGIYIYCLKATGSDQVFTQNKRMLLLK